MTDHADMNDLADTMYFHFKKLQMKLSIRLKIRWQGGKTKKMSRNKNVSVLLTRSEKKVRNNCLFSFTVDRYYLTVSQIHVQYTHK